MNFKTIFLRFYWLLSAQFGIDPRKMLCSLWGLPRYGRDFFRFRASYTGSLELLPCLHDWYEEGGTTKNEYFWQDLLVARQIFEAKPEKHVDVGSRVDGFVAHVASFREIEVFDIRPITTVIPGVLFKQVNLMNSVEEMVDYCDSLSCLHALEHFGLGRYGDSIDPEGHIRGIANLAALLKNRGILYLSVPIGINRVEFNASRVFDPRVIITFSKQHQLRLSDLTIINQTGKVETIVPDQVQLSHLANKQYTLGIFKFKKSLDL